MCPRYENVLTLLQGFRKYLTQARDHEELLSFLLGQIVKEKVRLFQLQRHQQPDSVTVKVAELDERVRVSAIYSGSPADDFCRRRNMIFITYTRRT